MALGDSNEIWVRHKNFAGDTIDEFRPMNPDFNLRINDADDISYDISLAEPTMRWGFVGPKRTTYELWIGATLVTAGHHSSVNTKRGEEVVHVFGKGWLWYFQNRHYPFDGLDATAFLGGSASSGGGLAYQAKKDPARIIDDIAGTILARPNSYPINLITNTVGVTIPFRIELADTTSLFDHIVELSNGATEQNASFDFLCDPYMNFGMYVPHRYSAAVRNDPPSGPAACVHTFSHFVHPEELTDSEFENDGPLGTHIMGIGAGTSSQLVRSLGYAFEQGIFGRWDMTSEWSDVMTDTRLLQLTQAAFSAGLYPQHNIPLTVKASSIPGFWDIFVPGEAIWIRQDYEAQNIDGAYRMLNIHGSADENGEILVDFELDQVNPLGNPGVRQG